MSIHQYFSMTALATAFRNAESCVHLMTGNEGAVIDCVPLPQIEMKTTGNDCDLEVKVTCPVCKKLMVETSKEIYTSFMCLNNKIAYNDDAKNVGSPLKDVEEKYSKL